MDIHGCVNGKLDDANYSSPVPLVGLYIAAASLVCFLAMLYDIVSGFRQQKQWLPCRLFSLNSVILTLLAIAAKIPVDLTTAMPSALDQISKLTGTATICSSMCFLMPSLGASHNFECLTNMTALSILVLTVVANICIQIRTGVIFLFTMEHVLIMCCMLLLLLVLWVAALDNNARKDVFLDLIKDHFIKGQGSMLWRLKLCYLYAFSSNPQLVICKEAYCNVLVGLCILCLFLPLRAASSTLLFKQLKLCGGISDYDWSISIIVVMQILVIIVGSFATSFRWYALLSKSSSNKRFVKDEVRIVVRLNPFLRTNFWETFGNLLHDLMKAVVVFVIFILLISEMTVVIIFSKIFQCVERDHTDMDQEYTDMIHDGDMEIDEWTLRKGVKDMKKRMEVSTSASLNHLSQLLSETCPSRPLQTMELKDQLHPDRQE